MSKYAPLNDYLKHVSGNHIPMKFSEIEKILGFKLPSSSRHHRAWWSNNPSNNVMTKAWIEAGFETAEVDIGGEKLVFQKTLSDHSYRQKFEPKPDNKYATDLPKVVKRNPLFGALKGLLVVKSDEALVQGFDDDWSSDDH